MTSLVFRAVMSVVNGAACAVNHLLEVISPVDIGHIWDDVPAGASGRPAPTGPTPGGVADPAEGAVPPVPSAGSLTWFGWTYPAIVEVLAEHYIEKPTGYCRCGDVGTDSLYDYHDHVAALIADAIACDPSRAIAALQNLQTQE